MITSTRYSVIFQKNLSRFRVAQKIPSSIRVAGTRWGLIMSESLFCDFEQMAVMMGTYYAMDRMSRMKGEGKQRNPCRGKRYNILATKCQHFSAELKSEPYSGRWKGRFDC